MYVDPSVGTPVTAEPVFHNTTYFSALTPALYCPPTVYALTNGNVNPDGFEVGSVAKLSVPTADKVIT